MADFISIAIIVVAIVVAALAGRAAWLRRAVSSSAGGRDRGRSAAASQGEIVAVIAAAVAAASGLDTEAFRIVGIRPSNAGAEGSGSPYGRGLNTPAWGHVDRFIQGESS